MTSMEQGPIFVTGADGEKGMAIVQRLLDLPLQHKHLPRRPVLAGLADASTERAKTLQQAGASVWAFDIFNEPERAVEALQGVTKLLLLIDPLNDRMTRNNVLQFAKLFVDAAKKAHVDHIIFLSPFSPAEEPLPWMAKKTNSLDENNKQCLYRPSFHYQFKCTEQYLLQELDSKTQVTILRYPGILHQHLMVFRDYVAEHNAFPLLDLDYTVESCNIADIARATAYIAHAPRRRHAGNVYKITGPQLLTLHEVSERMFSGLQRDHAVNRMDLSDLRQILYDNLGNDDHVGFLLEMWGLQQRRRRFEITRDLEALTGESGKLLNEYFDDDQIRDFFKKPNPSMA
ncbi:NAD(P)-binding protein [Hesseltinella vesiculosa]|uniref:NAD(P)-binding protein n=1 Tax=Hesseltinella vesiculosa TaxID=101127 RepID=A0A1X2G4R7_9FUNG|nr:NAD(P)-binding protein [Hesseltinella vesiculosa]